MDHLPSPPTTESFIGISVAIAGNILISFALNCQKLAHMRLERLREKDAEQGDEQGYGSTALDNSELGDARQRPQIPDGDQARARAGRKHPFPTSSPLASRQDRNSLVLDLDPPAPERPQGRLQRTIPNVGARMTSPATALRLNMPPITPRTIPEDRPASDPDPASLKDNNDSPVPKNETAYLKSKLWWIGFLLLNVGEIGNFISYAYAPASVVAPLGTFALIANCFFAPLMLKERFKKRDMVGIALSICGAVTVVYASKSSDIRLDPDALIKALKQTAFIVYGSICAVGIVVLAVLSNRRVGQDHIFVDVGLCALFGGFTVLATKGISTLLSLRWIEMFSEWITYPLIIVLAATGVGQIRYLNRALMKFDSKVVIPTQFVLFNLSAIVGSAMLYRDFDNISAHRFIVFLYGCITTFLGVLLLTGASFPSFSTPPPTPSEPGTPSSIHPSLSAGATDATPLLVRIVPSSPNLRNRASTASLGLSPAHYLLLATSAGSPPRVLGEVNGSGNALQFPRPRSASATSDREAAVGSPGRIGLPPTLGRRFGSTASAPTEPPRDREA